MGSLCCYVTELDLLLATCPTHQEAYLSSNTGDSHGPMSHKAGMLENLKYKMVLMDNCIAEACY